MLTTIHAFYRVEGITSKSLRLDVGVKAPLSVIKVEGLDPVAAQLSTRSYAVEHGVILQNNRVGARHIIIHIDYSDINGNPRQTQTNRDKLYEYFMPGYDVLFNLNRDGEFFGYLNGYVESFETDMWSPESKAKITVMCPDPFIQAPNLVRESLQIPANTSVGTFNGTYNGTVPTGFVFAIFATATGLNGITATMIKDGVERSITANSAPVTSGNRLVLKTVPGNRYYDQRSSRTQGYTVANLLTTIEPGAQWPMVYPGPFSLRFNLVRKPTISSTVDIAIEYRELFGGI